jgi:DNA end-binding protein Ku
MWYGIGSHRVPKQMVSLLSHILDTKPAVFDPAKFKDEYELALRKLVKRKAAGKTIEPPEDKEDRSNVVELMEALRQSVRGKGRRAAALHASAGSKRTSREARPRRGKRTAA